LASLVHLALQEIEAHPGCLVPPELRVLEEPEELKENGESPACPAKKDQLDLLAWLARLARPDCEA